MKELLDEQKLLEEVNQIYGISDSKNVIRNYAIYLKLRHERIIKFGNYNVLIRNMTEYNYSKELLIENICKLLKLNKVINTLPYYLDRSDIENICERKEELLIIDSVVIEKNILELKNKIKNYINKFPDKIYIFISKENEGEGWIDAFFGNLITWKITINKISQKDKKDYIRNILKENEIYIDEKNTFINCLSNEPFYKVKDELQNIIVECKEKNVNIITDDVIKNTLKKKYYANKKDNNNNKSNGIQELNSMIGLEEVKKQVNQIINYIEVNRKRGKMPMLHMSFLGNPRNRENNSC